MRLNFSPNTPRTRKKLIPGKLYLTIYRNAASICRSIYRGDDFWQNPESKEIATNSVAFFASASVFDIPSFNGWEHLPESDESNTPKRWESVTHYRLLLKADRTLLLCTPLGSILETHYPTSLCNNPTEWLSADGNSKAVLLENGSIVLSHPKDTGFHPTTFTWLTDSGELF